MTLPSTSRPKRDTRRHLRALSHCHCSSSEIVVLKMGLRLPAGRDRLIQHQRLAAGGGDALDHELRRGARLESDVRRRANRSRLRCARVRHDQPGDAQQQSDRRGDGGDPRRSGKPRWCGRRSAHPDHPIASPRLKSHHRVTFPYLLAPPQSSPQKHSTSR